MDEKTLGCDVQGCTRPAVTVLRFRGMVGHVHVCARCEATDREWADVNESYPLPCPWRCETVSQVIGTAVPVSL